MNVLPIVSSRDAVGDELFISGVGNPDAVVLHRGPSHFSPDGEHCCVRLNTDDRRCVTFSKYTDYIQFQHDCTVSAMHMYAPVYFGHHINSPLL